MQVFNDYVGASINIIENNEEKNEVILSLKKEGDSFSNYYNFKVLNSSNQKGLIRIKNSNNTLYLNDDCLPFCRHNNEEFRRMDKNRVSFNDDILITIEANEDVEISLYPRYVEDDLYKYIANNEQIRLIEDVIPKIVIGNSKLNTIVITARIHPGETMSSYFLEGIIDEIIKGEGDYCYVIFPMVNIEGIRNGNHRYYNGIDYNRIWNSSNCPKEIEYIKEEIKGYNIYMFVDIHGDEISKFDYIRTNNNKIKEDSFDIRVLKDNDKFRRFMRSLIKQKKIINVFDMTSREYIAKKYNCIGILVELSLVNNDIKTIKDKGRRFVKQLMKVK